VLLSCQLGTNEITIKVSSNNFNSPFGYAKWALLKGAVFSQTIATIRKSNYRYFFALDLRGFLLAICIACPPTAKAAS
jgi:hypothetical protein